MKTKIAAVFAVIVFILDWRACGQIPRASQEPVFTSQQRHEAYLQDRQNALWEQQQAALAAQRQAQQTEAKVAAWRTFRDAETVKLEAQRDKDLEALDAKQKLENDEIAAQLELIREKIGQLTAEKAVWVTNFIKHTPDCRMVNGQVYDTATSEKWGVPPYPEVPSLNSLDNPWNVIKYSVEFQQIKSQDKITCGIYRNEYKHETYTGQLGLENKQFVRWIIIGQFKIKN